MYFKTELLKFDTLFKWEENQRREFSEETMDPIHIHNLLSQLSSEVKCPHCNSQVRPHMISVENSSHNYCLLSIECHGCGELFYGHAHVGVKVMPSGEFSPDMMPEVSKKLPKTPARISQKDIAQLKGAFKNSTCQISDLFTSRK